MGERKQLNNSTMTYPKLHPPTQRFLDEISAETSAQIFSDEEDYQRMERETIERDEYEDQVRADCEHNDYSFLK
jgi:hypothetical protein